MNNSELNKRPLHKVENLAAQFGLGTKDMEPFGWYQGKLSLDLLTRLANRPKDKYIGVTAINPTPLGEGKTVTTIGLAMGLCRLGYEAIATLRQPSQGPVFALAIPPFTNDGTPFLFRGMLLAITFGVVLGSLVIQGLTLAPLVRWLGLNQQDQSPTEQEAHIRLELVSSAMKYLEQQGERMKEFPETVGRIRAHFERHGELALSQLTMLSLTQDEARDFSRPSTELYLGAIRAQRRNSSGCVIKAKSMDLSGSGWWILSIWMNRDSDMPSVWRISMIEGSLVDGSPF